MKYTSGALFQALPLSHGRYCRSLSYYRKCSGLISMYLFDPSNWFLKGQLLSQRYLFGHTLPTPPFLPSKTKHFLKDIFEASHMMAPSSKAWKHILIFEALKWIIRWSSLIVHLPFALIRKNVIGTNIKTFVLIDLWKTIFGFRRWILIGVVRLG